MEIKYAFHLLKTVKQLKILLTLFFVKFYYLRLVKK